MPSVDETEIASEQTWFDRWWFAVCAILLILGSDYKTRVRDPSTGLSGGIDAPIILELFMYGLVVLVLLGRGRQGHLSWTRPHVYLSCVFVGLIVVSAAYAIFPQYAAVRAGQMCVILAFVLVAGASADRAHIHRFAHLYLLVVVLSVAYGVVRPSPPVNRLQEGRFTWLAIHPTVSGVLAGLAATIAFGYLIAGRRHRSDPRWSSWVYVVILAITCAATLAAHTRGAVLGLLAGVLVLLAFGVRGRARLDVFAGLVVVVAFALLMWAGSIASYFARGQETEDIASLSSRTNLWSAAFEAARLNPMYGYGVGSARGLFYDDVGLGGGHNAVVHVLVEFGVVGLLCWGALIAAIVVGTVRVPASNPDHFTIDRAMILSIMAFLMVDGIFFEGPGSVANVASTWLFVCVTWLTVLQNAAKLALPERGRRQFARRPRSGR